MQREREKAGSSEMNQRKQSDPSRLPAFLLHLLSLSLVACPAKEDYTPQIKVQPGAAARAMWIASRARDAGAAAAAAPARVHVMKAGEELGGPNAVGKPGDLVIENDEVAFVVDGLGSSAGFAESGGNLVDAADAHARRDELGQLFTYFGTFPRQGVYSALTSGVAADGSAWAEAKGRELYEGKLAVTTRYTLHGGDRALLLETTLTNESDHVIEKLSLGDAIQWGGAEKLAPGKAVGFRGTSSGPYVGGIGRSASYAITSTDGTIDAISGGSWTDTSQRRDVALKPGESVSYARVFIVGARADAASIVAELTHAAGGELGAMELGLVDDAGKPLPVPADAKVVLATPSGAEVLSIRASGEGAPFGGEVPPGRYILTYASGGGRRGRGKATVDVIAGKTAHAQLGVSDAGRLKLACHDNRGAASPCKVTIEGVGGTASPDFGPAHAAGPAKNQITSADGAIDVPLSPGRYRVTLSRGPEYALAQWETEIAPGKEAHEPRPDASLLARVVDTSGYLATDFHQHTMLGADAPVGKVDRVIANAAEGVEVAVASEHNVVADLEPIVRELHLEEQLVAIAGDELTTDASRHPWGHANVFPLAVDPSRPRGGAPIVLDRTAKELFAELRAIKTPHVLQINHPRAGLTGYFEQYKLDRDAGVGTDPGYDPDFDALEVWNGRNVIARDTVLQDFFALLRTGHPVTATADTDTHGIVGQEAGYPRTYVRVADDKHLGAWSAARSDDLVRGVRELRDVVLTNGPLLHVTTEGVPIGGVARARGGAVTVKVHVECAPWVGVDRVWIARVSGEESAPRGEVPVALKPTPLGGRAADLTFTLRATKDDAFIVVATGAAPMSPVLTGDPKEITPYAMSGATWIDADGNGRALGR
jgi:hypothetical protein